MRLADSPSCIVTDEDDPSYQMQADDARHGPEGPARRQAHPRDQPRSRDRQKTPRPALKTSIAEDAAWLLFDQALLMEGVPLKAPALFVQRLNRILTLSV